MSTASASPIGSGADYGVRYEAELPEVMGRKLGLMDRAVNLAQTGQHRVVPTYDSDAAGRAVQSNAAAGL